MMPAGSAPPSSPSTRTIRSSTRWRTKRWRLLPQLAPFSFDAAQHLVSMAAGEPQRPAGSLRGRLARLLDAVSGSPRLAPPARRPGPGLDQMASQARAVS